MILRLLYHHADKTKCEDDEYECGTSGVCVLAAWRCDGETDCPNGEDEMHCDDADVRFQSRSKRYISLYTPVRFTQTIFPIIFVSLSTDLYKRQYHWPGF